MSAQVFKTMLDVPHAEVRPMTWEESEVYISATTAQIAGQDEVMSASNMWAKVDDENAPSQVRILVSRLTHAESGLRFSYLTVLFLSYLCPSPGRAVMWAHYLAQRTYALSDGAIVDHDVIASDFPEGFPTDEGAGKIWDAQKVKGGNGLDQPGAWMRCAEVSAA